MTLYEIALVASLLIILVLVLVNRRRYEARCPRCGEREGQLTVTKREISTRHVRYHSRWFAELNRHRQPMSADQRFLEGTMKCSRCGHSYQRRWLEQREMF